MSIKNQGTTRGVYCSYTEGMTMKPARHLNTNSFDVAPNYQWKHSSKVEHHEHSPVYTIHNLNVSLLVTKEAQLRHNGTLVEPWRSGDVIKRVHFEDEMEEQRKVLLQSIVDERGSLLPMSKHYYHAYTNDHHNLISSSHALVNKQRAKHNVLPLCREKELDELASHQAKRMATQQGKEHSDANDLIFKLTDSNAVPFRRIGENILKGKSIEQICRKLMYDPKYIADRNNISDRRFSSFGLGVAISKGKFYICQLYKG